MSRAITGVYQLPAGNPVVTGTTVESTWANSTLSDVAQEITNSLDRTGKGGMLAPLKLEDGSPAAPGVSFTAEPSSGMSRTGAGTVVISVLGTARVTVNSGGVAINGGLSTSGAVAATGNLSTSGNLTVDGNTVL